MFVYHLPANRGGMHPLVLPTPPGISKPLVNNVLSRQEVASTCFFPSQNTPVSDRQLQVEHFRPTGVCVYVSRSTEHAAARSRDLAVAIQIS